MDQKTQEQEVVEQIWGLQRRIFGEAWPRDLQQLLETYHLLISIELAELLAETNFKRHKKIKQIDGEKLELEAVDVVIYAFNIAGTVFDGDYERFLEVLQQKVSHNETRDDWDLHLRKVV
jgi:hypothetical protein